jgi:hypothetical protein
LRHTETTLGRIIAFAAAAIALAAAPAHAKQGEASSFTGTCSFTGIVRFDPPLTTTPAQGSGFARAIGSCVGTWTDRRGRRHFLEGDTVRYVAWNSGVLSCLEGLAEGGGYLRFRGERLDFSLSEARVTGVGSLTLEGEEGGSAEGVARPSGEDDPADLIERCSGPGLKQAGATIDLAADALTG